MKKPAVSALVLVTCIFASFVAGFAAGRNLNRTPVRIYQAASTAAEASAEPTAASTAPTGPVIVNINTATASELDALPGIGPVLAQRIIEYRQANGDFRAPEELTKVKGIGQARLEEIWDLITVGG